MSAQTPVPSGATDAMREITVDTVFGTQAALRNMAPAGATRVLALHGWLDNAASFVPLASHLAHVDLVALELPGHGFSAHLPAAADYTLTLSARAAFAFADALGWDRFVLLGHSLGGATATVMAAAQPARIERLALIESLGGLSEREDRTAQRLRDAYDAHVARPTRGLRVFDDVDTAIRARMQANGLSEPVARLLVERGIAQVAGGVVWRSDPRLTRATAVRMTEAQTRDLIAAIECPVHLIAADPPPPYFTADLRNARTALLRDGRVTVVPGTHHLHMETPARVAQAFGNFIDGAVSDVEIVGER